jgi:hypothetical protein
MWAERESSLMVPLCMWTERAVKWYHCVCGQREQSNGINVYVVRESSQIAPLCVWTEHGQVIHRHMKFVSQKRIFIILLK